LHSLLSFPLPFVPHPPTLTHPCTYSHRLHPAQTLHHRLRPHTRHVAREVSHLVRIEPFFIKLILTCSVRGLVAAARAEAVGGDEDAGFELVAAVLEVLSKLDSLL
jgi:hypothetical protein